jgi:hypothetical protein
VVSMFAVTSTITDSKQVLFTAPASELPARLNFD